MSRVFQYPKWKACVILISLGLFILGAFGISNLERDRSSLHWPSTSGIIDSATLERSGLNGPNARFNHFWADISYDYQIAGVSYHGTRVSFGGLWRGIDFNRSDKWRATRVLDHYPKGKQVTVFYDPSDPATAILEPKITDRTWISLAFGVIFLSWGVLPIIIFISRAEPKTNDAA